MSGLDELTREEQKALVLELHGTVQVQERQIAELGATVSLQAQRIAELEEEVTRLRGGKSSAPLWIRPSVQKKEKALRKKRKKSFARKNLPPTRVIYHALDQCPECGRKLVGESVKWRHQVIELPQVKVEVTDHLFVERRCGVCKKRWTPDPEVALAGVVDELGRLCKPYLKVKSAPQRVLAERMERFMGELFTFVEYPEAPSENNAAERAIRPAVVARKISGGTRSARGSNTASVLRSLFETWALEGQNTIDACREMITLAATAQHSSAQ